MEIRHLKLVKAIVEEGSIANAIDKLYLTPSALSHQLKEAEHQLGTKIFHRVNKKLLLTEAGQRVYDFSNLILRELDKVNKEVKEIISGRTGLIRISIECYTTYHWLPALIKKFHGEFPCIEVKIIAEATDKAVQKMVEGTVDLSVVCTKTENKNVEYIELFQDEMVAVVPENHPWTELPYVTAEDFKEVNLIIHSAPISTASVYKDVLKPEQVQPKDVTILPFTEACIEMIKAGLGVAVMAKWAIKPHILSNQIKTVKVTAHGLNRTQYAVKLTKESPEYLDYFIKYLKEEIKF